MKFRALPLASMFLPLLTLGAFAGETRCFVPMSNWQPRQAIIKIAVDHEWKIRRIKIDDGCYEIYGWDKDGNEIEVKLAPNTLEIVKFEFESFDDEEDEDEHDNDD